MAIAREIPVLQRRFLFLKDGRASALMRRKGKSSAKVKKPKKPKKRGPR